MAEGSGASKWLSRPLLGTEYASLDDKSRLLMSKEKRERIGDPFAMSLGELGCIVVYPMHSWEAILQSISEASNLGIGRQLFTEIMLAEAADNLHFDSQGRVVIPQRIRELAGIKKEVVVVGLGDRAQIWDREVREEYMKDRANFKLDRRQELDEALRMMREGR